jgi:hypothetical protein
VVIGKNVEHIMTMRRLLAAAVVAAVLATPVPAFAGQGDVEPVYNTHYYSDSTYTVEVGFDQGNCYYFGPGYSSHSGQATSYIQYELIGYCYEGMWEPL